MCCSLRLWRAKIDEFSFPVPFPDLGHVSAVLFFRCSSFPSFTSLFPVESGILHRSRGSAVAVPSRQAGGLPRNPPESKAAGKLQARAISDEQGGVTRWGTPALRSEHISNGPHAKTDTAESPDRFPLAELKSVTQIKQA